MPRIEDDLQPPSPSVLDRLLAGEGAETASYREAVANLRRSVLRDLGALLNARVGADPRTSHPLEEHREVGGEILRFGLPDITVLDLRNERKRQELLVWMAEAIRRFEPRLLDVRVSLRDADGRPGSTRFHVEGRLRVEPEPIRFPFEAEVRWPDRAVEIQGEKP